jgi:hypothetical protein
MVSGDLREVMSRMKGTNSGWKTFLENKSIQDLIFKIQNSKQPQTLNLESLKH